MVGGKSSIETYDGRGRRETDPPGAGFVRREDVAVETHTVIVSARVRPQDGFDRLGPWGKHSPPTTLPIDHYPQPPLFSTATSDGTNTTLTHDGVWSPDEIVASANGGVHFFCRIKDPVRYSAKVEEVIPSEDVLIVKLGVKPGESPPPTATFTGGQISIHTVHGDVLALSGEILLAAWPWVFAEVRHGDGPSVAISIGDTAQLAQSPTHADLFKHVHHEQAVGLQHAITFKDKMPDPTEVQLLEYRARIEFAGQMGPFGPAAQALRMPATPNVPPPFEVTTLGVDFYDRTVVLLQLTEPSDDLLEIWWAAGVFPSEPGKPNLQFSRNAVPGDAGVRGAEGGKVLFDTLSLPVPGKVPRSVTIGVQAVNGADGRSEFETVVHTLPAS
jgi:hypothetical protein